MNPYTVPGCDMTPEMIIKEWEKHFKMPLERVTWKDNSPDVAIPRHILCFALYSYASVSQTWIAGCVHRDRITVKNSITRSMELMESGQHKELLNSFISRLRDASGRPDQNYTIDVKLNREDLKKLLPDTDTWILEHWNLKALWGLYKESRFDKRKKDGNLKRQNHDQP